MSRQTPSGIPVTFSSGLPAPKARGLRKIFDSGALPPEGSRAWMIEVYGWLLKNLGGHDVFKETPLVLPNDTFFPVAPSDDAEETAKEMFARIKTHAGVDDWELDIAPFEPDADTTDLLGNDVGFGEGAARSGSISSIEWHGERAVIRYAPHLAQNPEVFVAAIVYEVARLLLLSFCDDDTVLPGVDAMDGPLLEVVVTFLGFGVFSANAVYNFERFRGLQTEGWNVSSLGELSEREVSFGLALFLALSDHALADARPYLKSNPKSYVAKSLKILQRDGRANLEELRAV